ncbi:MAG: hypothetical protein VB138_14520, partial [Burkholderia sp.]
SPSLSPAVDNMEVTPSLSSIYATTPLPDYDILAVYPQQRYVPAWVRYFIDYLREVYARPGYWGGTP